VLAGGDEHLAAGFVDEFNDLVVGGSLFCSSSRRFIATRQSLFRVARVGCG
jgi:hypothetical protein